MDTMFWETAAKISNPLALAAFAVAAATTVAYVRLRHQPKYSAVSATGGPRSHVLARSTVAFVGLLAVVLVVAMLVHAAIQGKEAPDRVDIGEDVRAKDTSKVVVDPGKASSERPSETNVKGSVSAEGKSEVRIGGAE